MTSLEENSEDGRARLYRAISGVIPGGSFIIEYMIDRIPDQRMERLIKFIEELDQRLAKLESREFLSNPEYKMLAENSLIESSRPISDKRIAWLASITVPIQSPTSLEIEFRRKAVDILLTLSDRDVEYLLSFKDFAGQIKYERERRVSHLITYGAFEKMSSNEIFSKYLENENLNIQRNVLLGKGLIGYNEPMSKDIQLTPLGKLFTYTICGKYPGKEL